MIQGFPDSTQFEPSQVQEVTARWEFKRGVGLGGANEGKDFPVPDGSVLVDFETHETSKHNTKGEPDLRVIFENRGPLRLPKGLHNGIRLDPDDVSDITDIGGASYTGDIKMKIVTEPDWYNIALRP